MAFEVRADGVAVVADEFAFGDFVCDFLPGVFMRFGKAELFVDGVEVIPCETDVGYVIAWKPAVNALSSFDFLIPDVLVFFRSLEVTVPIGPAFGFFACSSACLFSDSVFVSCLPCVHFFQTAGFLFRCHGVPTRLVLMIFSDCHWACSL